VITLLFSIAFLSFVSSYTLDALEGGEDGPGYICDHCEIPMQKSDEDLSTVGGPVVVKRGSYFCSKCGVVWDSQDQQQQQRVIKSQEKTGPRIHRPSEDFFFESIPSKSGLEPKYQTDQFDPEPNERQRLESEGYTVLEERITTSDGRTIVKR
jgi:hypothetical protein